MITSKLELVYFLRSIGDEISKQILTSIEEMDFSDIVKHFKKSVSQSSNKTSTTINLIASKL